MSKAWMRVLAASAWVLVCMTTASCLALFPVPEPSGEGGGNTGGAPSTCNVDKDCDDHEACTTDNCGEDKICVHTAAPDGPAPDSEQTAGDCKGVVCAKGVAKSQNDDNDIHDDAEDCTIDTCGNGQVFNTPKPDGTACDLAGNSGRCQGGKCVVVCTSAVDCPPPNPCQVGECDTTQGVCNYSPVSDGTPTPTATQPPGDCKVRVCMGGMDVEIADDTDVPATATDCDTEECNNGVPSNPGIAKHTFCSTHNGNQPGFCDGNGTCRECAEDIDCPGVTDDCKRPACDQTSFTCFQQNTPANTTTVNNPPQAVGDCATKVCDGNGGTMDTYNANDPQSDGVECTTDACTAINSTTHPNAPDVVTKCGTGLMLSCIGGVCAGCTLDSQCAPSSCNGTVLTKHETCNAGTSKCTSQPTQDCAPYLCNAAGAGGTGACTTTCTNDAGCSQGGVGNWCNAGSCTAKLQTGVACGGNNQCQSGFCVDGVCCNTLCNGSCQACSATKKGGGANGQCGAIADGTDPDNECPDDGAASCDRNGACNGAGACRLYAAGTVCAAASCLSGTLTKQKTCDGAGTCVTPSPATQNCAPYLCTGTACTTTCANDSQCASGNWCSGGMCVTKLTQGSACTGANQCQSNFCVDGYCCGSACNTACQACSAALKASGAGNGTCGNAITSAADPRNLCGTSPPCGNTGLCASGGVCQKTASGTQCATQTCSGSTLTAAKTCDGSGNCNVGGGTAACPGGLICNGAMTACLTACGTTDGNCITSYYCDGVGMGACNAKIATGTGSCGSNHECLSGQCGFTNGVCCMAVCPDQGAATCGTNGACQPGTGACQNYSTATSCSNQTCSGATLTQYDKCNGSGSCTGNPMTSTCPNGYNCNAGGTSCRTVCSTGSDCQSGYTCTSLTCKFVNGAACTQNSDCASGVCGTTGTGFCCAAACSLADPTCKAQSCAMGTGACIYPGSTTSCGASSCNTGTDTITASACNGAGTCAAGSPMACPGSLQCQDTTSCYATCGSNNPTGDFKCISGYYCDGTTCQTQKMTGAGCGRSGECVSGMCSASTCG